MIVAHIMDASLVSLVYPFSIFIYAMLEERRPKKTYWKFILFYTSIILFIKFLLQLYPISYYLTGGNVENKGYGDDEIKRSETVNGYLRTIRLGLVVIVDSSSGNHYFVYDTLVLLFVIFHIYMQVIGGVWNQREVDTESIQDAAVRIANFQKNNLLKEKGQKLFESRKHLIDSALEVDPENDIVLIDHYHRTRKRSHSMNDVLNLRQIRQDKIADEYDFNKFNEFPIEMDRWSD